MNNCIKFGGELTHLEPKKAIFYICQTVGQIVFDINGKSLGTGDYDLDKSKIYLLLSYTTIPS